MDEKLKAAIMPLLGVDGSAFSGTSGPKLSSWLNILSAHDAKVSKILMTHGFTL